MASISHLEVFVAVAGLTGAGKSSSVDTFFDLGFFTIDNLPVEMLGEFIELSKKAPKKYARTALLLDMSSRDKVEHFIKLFAELKAGRCKKELIFVDCDTQKILNRYNETRRPHPGFDPKADRNLEAVIENERQMLQPVKEIADYVIETSRLNVHDLRREIKAYADSFSGKIKKNLRLNFLSFGFKYGIPLDCDLLIDVRFLPNPYFEEKLREQSGLDSKVSKYVLKDKGAKEFIKKYSDLIEFLLPRYVFEGKSYLNIGVGCTGGKHRSIVIAEELFRRVDKKRYITSIKHRDLAKYSSFSRE